VLTLAAARGLARADRARARTLLAVDVPAPARPHGWRARLTDAAAWRALAYALLPGPVGLINGTLVLLAWTSGLAATTFPAYAWTLSDPALHLGGITVAGAPTAIAGVLVGLLVLAALPSTIRLLTRATPP
jgi:Putative sensor